MRFCSLPDAPSLHVLQQGSDEQPHAYLQNIGRLWFSPRSAEKLEVLAHEIRAQGKEAFAVPTDVTQEDAVRQLLAKTIERYGRVDILINNAGLGGVGAIAEYPVAAYRRLIELVACLVPKS